MHFNIVQNNQHLISYVFINQHTNLNNLNWYKKNKQTKQKTMWAILHALPMFYSKMHILFVTMFDVLNFIDKMKNMNRVNEEIMMCDLLENLKGERTPDESLAAHPKAFLGCSASGCKAISIAMKDKKMLMLWKIQYRQVIRRVYVAVS